MRIWLLAVIATLWIAPAQAQDADIQAVIDGQMQAFRAGNAGAAFEFASPAIREMFGTPENFAGMVQRGYPMIWSHGEVSYHDLRERDGAFMQRVQVRDAAGQDFEFEYEMIETTAGWRINAVWPVELRDLNA